MTEIKENEKKKTIEYYQLSKENFNAFLQQCRRAMDKIFGYHMSVKFDEWSKIVKDEEGNEITAWEFLKKYGYLHHSERDNYIHYKMGYSFIYGSHVYAYYEEL